MLEWQGEIIVTERGIKKQADGCPSACSKHDDVVEGLLPGMFSTGFGG